MNFHSKLIRSFPLLLVFLLPVTLYAQSSGDVNVNGSIAPDKVKKGRTVRATVVMEIPAGLHVQSSKPLDKYLIATKLDVETPSGMRVGPVSYPRPVMRKLKFSKGAVAVYEGRATVRFNVMVPANYGGSSGEIKGRLRFQACNDEACFPPVTREVKMWLNVE
ncbi:MAG TPA: protein-disulfide reductase DsbD domain-containing protein [Pyrinomonadaceae bacterium]|nr:protein-disulfide reductase DsbD domain-containing protein [Pyrinomonadaceae bacterium]